MPRKRTKRIAEVRSKLIERIESGYYHPGDRFFSNRAIADRFGISYRTAHVLLTELKEEGLIGREPHAGTYIEGGGLQYYGAALYFNERAKISDSFGYRLYTKLSQMLELEQIKWELFWTGPETELLDGFYPVMWESPRIQQLVWNNRTFGLLLNKKPDPGLSSSWIDSIALDDYSGGVMAAQLIQPYFTNSKIVIFSGPDIDYRNNDRVNGFKSVLPAAEILSAGTWYYDDGYRLAGKIVEKSPDVVFACNDRLASAYIDYCNDHNNAKAAIMGFDNAPISEILNISTIAIPWDKMIDLAVEQIVKRLKGDTSPTVHYLLHTRQMIRGTDFRNV